MFPYLYDFGSEYANIITQFTHFAPNISVDGAKDLTFEFTLKALMHKRVKNSRMEVVINNNNIAGVPEDEIAQRYLYIGSEAVFILNITSSLDDYNKALKDCERVLDNYVRNEAAERFLLQKNLDACLYTRKDKGHSVIVAHKIDGKLYHALQSLIPVAIPSYFEAYPLEDSERELLNTLLETKPDAYKNWIVNYIKSLDLRTANIKTQLSGYTSRFADTQTANLEEKIRGIDNRVSEYERAISDLIRSRDSYVDEIAGLRMRLSDKEDTSLIDFFIASKALNLNSVCGSDITFEVNTTLDNYDMDLYEKYRKNPRSPFNVERNYYDVPIEDGQLLMDAIFSTQKVKVNMRACFTLNFANQRTVINRDFTEFTRDCLDNPHLTAYRCLGNNGPKLTQYLRSKDYMMALSTCISIAGNLNIAEVNNDENFMNYLFCNDERVGRKKVIKLSDGTNVTVDDAIAYLKKGAANE